MQISGFLLVTKAETIFAQLFTEGNITFLLEDQESKSIIFPIQVHKLFEFYLRTRLRTSDS